MTDVTNQLPNIVSFPIHCFDILGKVHVIVKPFGKGELQLYKQNLKPEEVGNTEVYLARLGRSGGYMVVKKSIGLEQYEFCDVVRRVGNGPEAPWYLKQFLETKIQGINNATPIYVAINAHETIRCTIPDVERAWLVVGELFPEQQLTEK